MPTCARCGRENPDGFKFCGECGSALVAPSPSAEERKLVTVLFCDLVGFTARSDRADPEDVRATLRPYHERLRREVERYGGTVEKFIGDAIMAVFGAPVAHEDDAERAVRAGLRILEEIRTMNAAQSGLDLSVRIGIETGEAVVAIGARPERGEGIATGDVVNTAARLQTSAMVDSIVVGELTHRTTKQVFDYEELDPAVAKGKQDPLLRWRAVRAKSGFGVDTEQAGRTPLIGREAELGLLEETFRRTQRDAAPQLVTLTGEPGVGKTRLVWEFRRFVDELPQLVYWRQGRCLPYGEGITFWALGEIVKAQAGIVETDEPDEALVKLDDAVRLVAADSGEAEWLKSRLAPLIGGRVGVEAAGRDEAFGAWRRFLELVAARDPLVVVFEDLHWADPSLIEFVDHLVEWASGVPILVLCTGRPELYDRHPGWGGGKRNSVTVALSPLGTDETARLLSELLSRAVLPAEVQGTLIERSGGNPLYTEEFVKMLVDRGILSRADGDGSWRIARDSEIALPESLQALIAARLDTLPPEQKALIQDASVLGKVFWSGGVAVMSGVDDTVVRRQLQDLVRREFIRPARTSSMSGHAEYSFWHVLIRDVAYGQIPRAARGRKHRSAAEWIESTAGERVVDHSEFLAHHYGQAFDLALAAGDETDSLIEPLRGALVLAGDRAQRLDVATAEQFYRRALDLIPAGDPAHARIMVKALIAAGELGSMTFHDVVAGLDAAADVLRRNGDVEAAAEALLGMVLPLSVSGDTDRGERVAREAVAMLSAGPEPLLARAYTSLCLRLMLSGAFDECEQATDRALDLAAKHGLTDVTARALQFRGTIRCLLRDVPAGLADLRESLEIALRNGFAAASAYVNLASETRDQDGPDAGLAVYLEGIEHCKARSLRWWEMWTKAEVTWLLFGKGDWDECLLLADEIIEWDRRFGDSQIGVAAMGSKADVLLARGRIQEAKELSDAALPRARSVRDPQMLIPAMMTAAGIDVALGSRSEIAREIPGAISPGWASACLPGAVRALVQSGALDEARAYLEDITAPTTRTQIGVLASRALVHEAAGDHEEAAPLHAESARRWAEFGFPYEQAQSLIGCARCLVSLDRADEALGPLTEARHILSGLGALPLLGEVSSLLELAEAAASG